MKSKFLFLILAAIAAALCPWLPAGQLAKERTPSQGGAPAYKYEAFAGAGYTSLNQVNLSRYGLIGGQVGVTRDFGKHFGITALGAYYKPPTGKADGGNPGDPSVVFCAGRAGVSRQPLRQLRRLLSRPAWH